MKVSEESNISCTDIGAGSILITGGAGFIGSHLCEKLLELGYKVINIDSLNGFYDISFKRSNLYAVMAFLQKNGISADRYAFCQGDIRDGTFLEGIFGAGEIDAIIHLAAYAGVRPSIENPLLYMDVNVNGTVNMLEMAKKYNINKFIFASSSSVYGNSPAVPFSEAFSADMPISPYAASKKAGELICHTYSYLYGISMACLRFFTVYGPRQRPDLAICKFTRLMFEDREIPFYGDGSMGRDYTYITDIVDGIVRSVNWAKNQNGNYEIFNLGNSNPVSLKEMVKALEKATGRRARLHKMENQPGDMRLTYADIAKSRSILGYDPAVRFEDGVKAFVDWYLMEFGP